MVEANDIMSIVNNMLHWGCDEGPGFQIRHGGDRNLNRMTYLVNNGVNTEYGPG